MVAHSPIPPSSASRWVNCPASASLEAAEPDNSGLDSLEGEASHYAAAEFLAGRIPQAGEFADNAQVLTDEMIRCARVFADTVAFAALPVKVEQRVYCPVIHSESFGTPDAYGYCPTTCILYVYDYKYGFLPVDAYENWQCINYVAGLLSQYPDCKEIVITIVQPRAVHPDGSVRTWRITLERILPYIARLKMMARVAMSEDERYIKTGPHCRYCKVLSKCPAAASCAAGWFDFIMGPTMRQSEPHQKAVEYDMLKRAKAAVEHRLDAIETEMVSDIKSGKSIPGKTLETTYSRLGWDIPPEDVEIIGLANGVDLRSTAMITPTQARDQKKIDPEVIKQFASRKPNGLKLVDTNGKKLFGG